MVLFVFAKLFLFVYVRVFYCTVLVCYALWFLWSSCLRAMVNWSLQRGQLYSVYVSCMFDTMLKDELHCAELKQRLGMDM